MTSKLGDIWVRYKVWVKLENKKWYKNWRLWVSLFVVIALLNLIVPSNIINLSTQDKNTKIDANENIDINSEKESNKATSSLFNSYNSIIIGDIVEGGKGGLTFNEVVNILGSPNSTNESTTDGVQFTTSMWDDFDSGDSYSSLTVTFTDGLAVDKSLSRTITDDTNTVTDEKFETISTDGDFSTKEVIEILGLPGGMTENISDGITFTTMSWTSNPNGNSDTYYGISFQDDVAFSKTKNTF